MIKKFERKDIKKMCKTLGFPIKGFWFGHLWEFVREFSAYDWIEHSPRGYGRFWGQSGIYGDIRKWRAKAEKYDKIVEITREKEKP